MIITLISVIRKQNTTCTAKDVRDGVDCMDCEEGL